MNSERKDLGSALRSRAERAGLTPADFGDVQRRARRIRRRRTSLAVAGAAASIAVVAGLGFALASGDDHRSSPIAPSQTFAESAPATPSPQHERTLGANPDHASAPSAASGTKLFPVDVSPTSVGDTVGGEPGVPMWQDDQGGTIIAANGSATKVGERVTQFVQTAPGQWSGLIKDRSTGGWAWTTYQTDGKQPTFRAPSADSVAVTPDGASVAWLWWPQDTGRTADTPSSWTLSLSGPHQHQWQVGNGQLALAGILANGDVVFNDNGVAKIARQDGRITDLGSYRAISVSTATGAIAVRQANGCSAIVDENGTAGPDACGLELGQFSADGSLLLGYPVASAQAQSQNLAIVRASDLSAVAMFQAPGGGRFDPDLAWSDHTVVVPVYGEGKWSIAWLSHDGAKIGRASGRPGSPSASPYLFGAGPLTATH